MCLMSSSKGIDIWLEIGEFQAQVSTHFQTQKYLTKSYATHLSLLEQSRILSIWRLNDEWDFKVHIRSRSSSTPIRPLSLYRPLRESHRPQGVDIDHFGYPWFSWKAAIVNNLSIVHFSIVLTVYWPN
ncbi:hypothetical protein T06_14811 [Trichinella sp. T6]|nr:hypothetical protein T06_14811 [Trichinella sp. T6]